jgi:two-component system response regulator AtoC
VPTFGREAMTVMRSYRWPGNVRELRNVVERAVLLCQGDLVTVDHLPLERMARPLAPSGATSRDDAAPARPTAPPPPDELRLVPRVRLRDDKEREQIKAALDRCGGNQTQAAKLLGISRRTLVSRVAEYAMPRPRKRD